MERPSSTKRRWFGLVVAGALSLGGLYLAYETWWAPIPCDDRTYLGMELKQLGRYRLDVTGEGYRAHCTLVLRKPSWYLEASTGCEGDRVTVMQHEKAVEELVLWRAVARPHVELSDGSSVLYAGDVPTTGYGPHGRYRCEIRRGSLKLANVADAE
jgi:hypothetical protein